MTSSWRSTHFLTACQLFSEARAALWEMEEESFFFFFFVFLCIFKDRIWHCCNYQHLLHWPQHACCIKTCWTACDASSFYIYCCSALGFGCTGVKEPTLKLLTALLVPYLNLIIKNFLNSDCWWLTDIELFTHFSHVKSWCKELGIFFYALNEISDQIHRQWCSSVNWEQNIKCMPLLCSSDAK